MPPVLLADEPLVEVVDVGMLQLENVSSIAAAIIIFLFMLYVCYVVIHCKIKHICRDISG